MSSHILDFENAKTAFAYKTTGALKRARFIMSVMSYPTVALLATWLVKVALKLKLPVLALIKKTVYDHFCGGETIEKSAATIKSLNQYGVCTILDYSVEGKKTEAGFDHTAQEIMHTLETAGSHEAIPFCVFKPTGLASFDLLMKIQSGKSLSATEAEAFERAKARIDNICNRAHSYGIPILVDAEHSWIQQPVDDITYAMMRKYNREKAIVFNTYQMYLSDKLDALVAACENAQKEGYKLGVKIVRGAYMEQERARAARKGYPSPVCVDKAATDQLFDSGLHHCLERSDLVSLMCCTHNEHSNQLVISHMRQHGIAPDYPGIWFAQLLGMSDNISFNLAREGYNVAKYVPYGPVKAVMPYLIRRAGENASVAGQTPRELMMIRNELKRRRN